MILTAKHLVTGDGVTCMENAALSLGADGRIAWVGTQEDAKRLFPQEEWRDYGDATILPGLMDMHVHFGYYYS
ncbi:MAG: amidohydrolase family protein, partial [Clostridium sp.]|nr:amidohydrolase family protein [Clostridium sp.]